MTNKNSQNQFRNFSAKYTHLFDEYIKSYFDSKINGYPHEFAKEILSDIKEYCLRDGKRIRPLLLLNSYIGYKRGFKKIEEIIKLGAAVEIMHSLLLIQDDIIDRSPMRRGGKAMHILLGDKYRPQTRNEYIGTDIASIVADIMFSCSLEIIANAKIRNSTRTEFLKIFSQTYEKTAWGQILDSLNTLPITLEKDTEAPMLISLMKTAYYTIAYPMTMGYVLSGGQGIHELEAIKNFGLTLGLAFQIRDDILSIFGVESETGKPSDSDLVEGKFTLLIHNTMQKLSDEDFTIFREKFLSQSKTPTDIEWIRCTIKDSGGLEETINSHESLIDEAYAKVEELSIKSANKEVLKGIIEAIEDLPI